MIELLGLGQGQAGEYPQIPRMSMPGQSLHGCARSLTRSYVSQANLRFLHLDITSAAPFTTGRQRRVDDIASDQIPHSSSSLGTAEAVPGAGATVGDGDSLTGSTWMQYIDPL